MTVPIRIGLIGLGKISVDQHIPSVAANRAFRLVGGVSPDHRVPGVDGFDSLDALLADRALDAVAVNTPPQVRFRLAQQALLAGKHVLLEKPPCATLAQLDELVRISQASGVSLYTAWHSQHAPAVAPARAWLSGTRIRRIELNWRENVREWHPGQQWLWQPGGFGVFDPGINAVSILTRILPGTLVVERAVLRIPANGQTPIAADLEGSVGESGRLIGKLDFQQPGPPVWSIEIATDRGTMVIGSGGSELLIDGERQHVGPADEYASIYRRFADLIRGGASDVDATPLAVVADAFLIGERVRVAEFIE
ncbi:MAG TPA: Gfo/Idh/MocA family oxidoreductase [Pseudomonadales bacterium]